MKAPLSSSLSPLHTDFIPSVKYFFHCCTKSLSCCGRYLPYLKTPLFVVFNFHHWNSDSVPLVLDFALDIHSLDSHEGQTLCHTCLGFRTVLWAKALVKAAFQNIPGCTPLWVQCPWRQLLPGSVFWSLNFSFHETGLPFGLDSKVSRKSMTNAINPSTKLIWTSSYSPFLYQSL